MGAKCSASDALLILETGVTATGAHVGPLESTTGGGALCLYVAAVNAAGESTRVKFPTDFNTP